MAAPTSRLTQQTLTSQASDTVHRLKEAVCQVDTKSPGTGFLVTPSCLLTCCHVLSTKEVAQDANARFSEVPVVASRALNPDSSKNGFYHSSSLRHEDGKMGFTAKHLDFALVSLETPIETVSALFELTDQFPPQKEQIHVIQHPLIEVTKRDAETGRALTIQQLTGEKRIATGQITEFDQYTVHHTALVAGGSSGAPIVNNAGHLYAFHQAECTNPAHKKCTNPEHAKSKNPVHKDCEILLNCGIGVRTDAVFRYLRDHHITLDNFEEVRAQTLLYQSLKTKYAKNSHLELIRPVRGYKDWMLKFPIDAIYTELVILLAGKKKEKRDEPSNPDKSLETYETQFIKKEIVSREKFFSLLRSVKKVLIIGAAGTGKTTFCQYLTFQWSQDRVLTEYQALFWIRLRYLQKNDTLDSLFSREFGITNLSDKHFSSTLLILDGFDELPPDTDTLFRQLSNKFQHVIVTSRPKSCIPFCSVAQLEIIGLDTHHSSSYIQHYFTALHHQYPTELSKDEVVPKTRRLQILLLTHPLLSSLAHIPVNLGLLCSIFSQEEAFLKNQQPITVTNLYNYIVNWLYTCFQLRQRDIKTAVSDLMSQCNPLTDPTVRDLDHVLSCIALDFTQNNTLYTVQTDLEDFLIDQNAPINIGQLNDSGLYKVESGEGEFIHLSYQDFFVARHLVSLYTTKERKKAEKNRKKAQKFLKAHLLQERYKWIFWMTAGLLSIRHPSLLPEYFIDLHYLVPDPGKSYKLRLLARCYEECLDPDVLPTYSHFLNECVLFLKEHPKMELRSNLFRDCPRFLSRSEVLEVFQKFSVDQQLEFLTQLAKTKLHIPETLLKRICLPEKAYRALFLLKEVVLSQQILPDSCLEYVCSELREEDTQLEIGLDVLRCLMRQQMTILESPEAVIAWIKNLNLIQQTEFRLFVTFLTILRENPKMTSTVIVDYFIKHSLGAFLNLNNLNSQQIFNKLLYIISYYTVTYGSTPFSVYEAYRAIEDNKHDILQLLTLFATANEEDQSQTIAILVERARNGDSYAGDALMRLSQAGLAIPDTWSTSLKEKPERKITKLLTRLVKNNHLSSKETNKTLSYSYCYRSLTELIPDQNKQTEKATQSLTEVLKAGQWNRCSFESLKNTAALELIVQELVMQLFSNDNFIAGAVLEELNEKGYIFSLEYIDQFICHLKNKDIIDDYTYEQVTRFVEQRITGHPDSHLILEKIKQELKNKDLDPKVKRNFAHILAKAPPCQLPLIIIENLVSCFTNSTFHERPESTCLVEIDCREEKNILKLILQQKAVKLTERSIASAVEFFGSDNGIKAKTLALLNYQDYCAEPWSRELFIRIAYLTGQPFIEVDSG